jgi:hypothetical protein
MIQAAFFGGLFIGILSALPIIQVGNCCCCLWILSGGALAAYLDRQNDPRPMTVGRGAFAGLVAGAIGALVWLVAAVALNAFIAPLQERMAAVVLQNARDMPPEVRDLLEGVGTQASSPFRWVLGFVFQLFAGAVFATSGGALAAVMLRRDNVPPALGGDTWTGPPPPMPPQ